MLVYCFFFFFFFKQKTASEMRISDWSSDVCSSDLSEALLLTLLWATWRRARAARCARALIRRFAPPSPASGRRAGVDQHAGSRQELAAVAPPTRTSPSASRQP